MNKNTNKNKITKKRFVIELATAISLVIFSLFVIVANARAALASEINEENILRLINKERTYRGIPSLEIDERLDKAAIRKTEDMINRNYFEHYAFGLTPWNFITEAGYNYLYAGENLAMDFDTSEGMVRSWMQSTTHRNNILNPDFDETGIGIVKGEYTEDGNSHETYMVTNMFAREKPAVLRLIDRVVNFMSNIF